MEHISYGLWLLIIVNLVIFILFAYSFTNFKTGRDWRAFGTFYAFVVAYFTEIIQLSFNLLSGWLTRQYTYRTSFDYYSAAGY